MEKYYKMPLIINEPFIYGYDKLDDNMNQEYQYSGDKLQKNLIPLNSSLGIKLLHTGIYNNFYNLISYFTTERGLTFCGIASSVISLNAIGLSPPINPKHAPYKIFDQYNFFNNSEILKIFTPSKIQQSGATLEQLNKAIRVYCPNSNFKFAGDVSINTFRDNAIDSLKSEKSAIIINFCRLDIHEIGCGHFSPLGAYNPSDDRFLILDVARYKYPPVWVKTSELFKSLQTIDNSSKKTRGYIILNNI